MHYTARSKAEPVFLVKDVSMQVWVGASARGHAHEQPQQLRYNWLPAALFFPTVIKVRSSFQPHGLARVGDKKVRIVRLLCARVHVSCAATSNWTLHTYLEAQERATSVTTSLLRSLSPSFSLKAQLSRFYMCNSVVLAVCHRNDFQPPAGKKSKPTKFKLIFSLSPFLRLLCQTRQYFFFPCCSTAQIQTTNRSALDIVHSLRMRCVTNGLCVSRMSMLVLASTKGHQNVFGSLNRYPPVPVILPVGKADDEKRREEERKEDDQSACLTLWLISFRAEL